jgi:hypothetical protein
MLQRPFGQRRHLKNPLKICTAHFHRGSVADGHGDFQNTFLHSRAFTKSRGERAGSFDITDQLDRLKWSLWHGNVYKALQKIEYLEMDLEAMEESPEQRKLRKAVREFGGYIAANKPYIPNYGDWYRNGEPISTAMVESTVNQVISKRFVKKQQMKWTKRGAHLLLQVRTHVLNDDLRDLFCRWYPGMQTRDEPV